MGGWPYSALFYGKEKAPRNDGAEPKLGES
jgi:hypothetical protein